MIIVDNVQVRLIVRKIKAEFKDQYERVVEYYKNKC